MYHNSARAFLCFPHSGRLLSCYSATDRIPGSKLPAETFPGNTYDVYAIAFGIRHVTSIPDILREAHRVLKPGVRLPAPFIKATHPVLAQYVLPSNLPLDRFLTDCDAGYGTNARSQ